jgi:protein phosphatase
MSERTEPETEEIPFQRSPDAQRPDTGSSRVRVDLAGLSDKGKVRENNEDHYMIVGFGRFLETLSTNLPEEEVPAGSHEVGYGLVVADGMGGHSAGEVASRLALQTLVRLVANIPDWILLPDHLWTEEILRRAEERCQGIHALLTERSKTSPQLHRMGTTLTVTWSLGKELFIAHVGDSRAYRFRKGQLHRFTEDHTLAQAMAERGFLRPDEVPRSRLRHVLTQTLGGGASTVKPDLQQHQLQDGDCLLLCTDGLTDMVDDETIAAVLASNEPSAHICQRLVDLALERGGKDNVTVVVARYDFSEVD